MEWKLILLYGYGILLGAIVVNALASLLKITTWHAYFLIIKENGFWLASSKIGIASLIFMYIAYPVLLGTVIYYLTKLQL